MKSPPGKLDTVTAAKGLREKVCGSPIPPVRGGSPSPALPPERSPRGAEDGRAQMEPTPRGWCDRKCESDELVA